MLATTQLDSDITSNTTTYKYTLVKITKKKLTNKLRYFHIDLFDISLQISVYMFKNITADNEKHK